MVSSAVTEDGMAATSGLVRPGGCGDGKDGNGEVEEAGLGGRSTSLSSSPMAKQDGGAASEKRAVG